MTVIKNRDGNNVNLALEGRLDTTTAPQLEEALKENMDGVETLTLDMEKLEYVSSLCEVKFSKSEAKRLKLMLILKRFFR